MPDDIQSVIAFMSDHHRWTAAVMFVIAFGESIVVLSVLFPGTTIMFVAGTLLSSGQLAAWPFLMGATAGAVLGDWVSYWVGQRYGHVVERCWPFTRRPQLLANGYAFFERHGDKSVFIGRFFGPARAVVPLAAGILRMPAKKFWIANLASAAVWAPGLLICGALAAETVQALSTVVAGMPLWVALLILLLLPCAAWVVYRCKLRFRVRSRKNAE